VGEEKIEKGDIALQVRRRISFVLQNGGQRGKSTSEEKRSITNGIKKGKNRIQDTLRSRFHIRRAGSPEPNITYNPEFSNVVEVKERTYAPKRGGGL